MPMLVLPFLIPQIASSTRVLSWARVPVHHQAESQSINLLSLSLSYPTLSLFCFFSTKLIAEDVDSKPNGQIRFSIVGGDRDNEFAVDPILGLVKVKKKLDRERVSKFR